MTYCQVLVGAQFFPGLLDAKDVEPFLLENAYEKGQIWGHRPWVLGHRLTLQFFPLNYRQYYYYDIALDLPMNHWAKMEINRKGNLPNPFTTRNEVL